MLLASALTNQNTGKPEDVKAVDWDKDYVDLEWKPPTNDGLH